MTDEELAAIEAHATAQRDYADGGCATCYGDACGSVRLIAEVRRLASELAVIEEDLRRAEAALGCEVVEVMSCVCRFGTKACVSKHEGVAMTEPTDDDRARLRAWLDRRPPQRFDAVGLVGAALLEHRAWRAWFDDGEYLGEVSARVGPDAVDAKQRCGCEQCDGRATK